MNKKQLDEHAVSKTIQRLKERQYRSDELASRFGPMGTPQLVLPGVSIKGSIPSVRDMLDNVASPLNELPQELQVPHGHQQLDRDMVLTSYAKAATSIIGTGVIMCLAREVGSLADDEAERTAAELVLGSRHEEFMADVAAFTGIMAFENTSSSLRLVRVADVLSTMKSVELTAGRDDGPPDVRHIDVTPDNFDTLKEAGFDFSHAAIHSVAAVETRTPVVVHWGPTRIEEEVWDACEMEGERRDIALTITVAHRQHGYLSLTLTIGLDEEYEPTLTLCHAVAETVEEHNDPERFLISIDPFHTRAPGVGGSAYEVVDAAGASGGADERGAAAMLRALADVLEGKSNRIEWDEKFDNDDEDISPHSMGRKAKA